MTYLRAPYAGIARALAGALVLVALVGTGYLVGRTTKVHEARAARERDCARRIEEMATRRGYSVIRTVAMPCEYERAR